MKKQQQLVPVSSSNTSQNHPILRDIHVLATVKCKSQNLSQFVCFKQGCEKYPFICSERQCLCRKDHQKCVKTQTYDFIEKLQTKIANSSQLVQYHTKTIDFFIQSLTFHANQMKKLFKNEFYQKISQFTFTPVEIQTLQKIHQNNVKNMKGHDFFEINYQNQKQSKLKLNNRYSFDRDLQTQEIEKKWNQMRVQVIHKMDKLKHMWNFNKKFKAIYRKYGSSLQQSKIVKTTQEENTIIDFFTKKINKFELLYRASQNQYKLNAFHKNCDGVSNTLTIVKTEFGKKIGGFTPLTWRQFNIPQGQQQVDPQKSTFIFSLSHNQKLNQKDQKVGIINHQKYGPAFGNSKTLELCLSQQSNKGRNCFGSFSKSFIHQNQPQANKKTHQRFTGNPNSQGKFNAKEWQVWKVIFKDQTPQQKHQKKDKIK